jgi:drug/metabolite transporter (DMT)-like permease
MSNSNLVRLLLLSLIWGTSFMLMRIAAPVFGPMLTTFGRAGLGALALYLFARYRGVDMAWRRNAKFYLVVGLANTRYLLVYLPGRPCIFPRRIWQP